jgi:hypothetical protein
MTPAGTEHGWCGSTTAEAWNMEGRGGATAFPHWGLPPSLIGSVESRLAIRGSPLPAPARISRGLGVGFRGSDRVRRGRLRRLIGRGGRGGRPRWEVERSHCAPQSAQGRADALIRIALLTSRVGKCGKITGEGVPSALSPGYNARSAFARFRSLSLPYSYTYTLGIGPFVAHSHSQVCTCVP